MTALVTADWHLTDHAKDRYRFRALEFLFRLIKEEQVDQLIILGDLTHFKNKHSDTLVNDIVDLLYDLSQLCPLYILQGNHDYVEADTAFFCFIRHLKNVHWINRPTAVDIEGLGPVLFLPHTRDYKKSWKQWPSIEQRLNLIFAHNAFEGAISENGSKLQGIPLDVMPDVPIIAGDIHKPQRIKQLTYVGAPYTQKFGDDYEPRVLLLLNQDESTHPGIKSIPVPGPQKVLIDVSSKTELDKALLECGKDDMIKVRYQLKEENRASWPELSAAIKRSWPSVNLQPILEKRALARLPTRSKKTDLELVTNYAKQQQMSAEALEVGYELTEKH